MAVTAVGWALTIGVIVALLGFDLALATARPHAVGYREAAVWSAFYIAVAVAFGLVFAGAGGVGLRRAVLRRIPGGEEPVGGQPVRLRDHHDGARVPDRQISALSMTSSRSPSRRSFRLDEPALTTSSRIG